MATKFASHLPKMASDDGVVEAVKAALGDALLDVKDHVGEITLTVRRESIVEVCRALRDTPGLEYQQLMDIAGVDYPERPERFEVDYQLLSLTKNRRIRVKVTTDEQAPRDTRRYDNVLCRLRIWARPPVDAARDVA